MAKESKRSDGPGGSPLLQWHQACDLLGGISWEDGVAHWRTMGLDPDQENALHLSGDQFATPQQFFFQRGLAPVPLEALWLKWNLFLSVCRRVQAYHRTVRRPHLGLNLQSVFVSFSDPRDSWLPVRWLFVPHLGEGRGAVPFHHPDMPGEMAQWLVDPSFSGGSLCDAPAVRDWPLGREELVTALIRSLDRIQTDHEGEVRGLLRLHVVSDIMSQSLFGDKDVFRLSFSVPGKEKSSVVLWARMIDTVERGIVVTGATVPLPDWRWTQLDQAKDQVISAASVAVYRAFPMGCDVFSLGMLLVYALLVNESHSFVQVQQADHEGEVRGLLRLHVVSDIMSQSLFGDKDVFRLSFSVPGKEKSSVVLWARMIDTVERGIVVTGATVPLPDWRWTQLDQAKDQVISAASVAVYRAFPMGCDVFSLGMLLVYALLVNESHSFVQVQQAVQRLVDGLPPAVQGLDPDDPTTLVERITPRLHEEGSVFHQSSLFARSDRSVGGDGAVPEALWSEVLIFVFRLVSDIPGFGFISRRGGRDGVASTSAMMDAVVMGAESLANRMKEGFVPAPLWEPNSARESQVILQACRQVRRGLTC